MQVSERMYKVWLCGAEREKSEGMEGAKSPNEKEAPEQICTQSRRSILRELEWNR